MKYVYTALQYQRTNSVPCDKNIPQLLKHAELNPRFVGLKITSAMTTVSTIFAILIRE